MALSPLYFPDDVEIKYTKNLERECIYLNIFLGKQLVIIFNESALFEGNGNVFIIHGVSEQWGMKLEEDLTIEKGL